LGGEGFVTNVEGLLEKFKKQVLLLKDDDELDSDQKTRIKTILKGIEDVVAGERQITIKLKDDTGNSAIISDVEGKVKVKKLRASKK
jgi:C4-type Zn-finger protein